MLYLWIPLALLVGGGIFIGVRAVVINQQKKKNKDKKAHKLEFEIGPVTLQ